MAKHNLFDNPDGKSPEESSDNGKDKEKEDSPQGLSAADVQTMIETATSGLKSDNKVLTDQLTALRARQTAPAPIVPAIPITGEKFIEDFTNDAPGAVSKLAQEKADEKFNQMLPFLRQQNDTMHQTLIDSERRAVEAEYGAEAWTTHFEPILTARMADLRESNAQSLSDPNVMRTEVLGVMGLKRNELAALKATNTTAASDAKEAEIKELMGRFELSGMTGGNNAPTPNTSKELTEAEKLYIISKKNAGMEVDIHKLRRVREANTNSFADYQEHMKATENTS